MKPVTTESLETAAKLIDGALAIDRQYPELDQLLKKSRMTSGTLVMSFICLLCKMSILY